MKDNRVKACKIKLTKSIEGCANKYVIDTHVASEIFARANTLYSNESDLARP